MDDKDLRSQLEGLFSDLEQPAPAERPPARRAVPPRRVAPTLPARKAAEISGARAKRPKAARFEGKPGAQPTIGWLTQTSMNTLSVGMWAGANDAAREQGANLLFVPGNVLRSPIEAQAQANVVYDLIGPKNLNGLLIWGGLLAQHITLKEFKAFCKRYRPLPVVNIAMSVQGIPSVWADNHAGMRDAVRHLVEAHEYRRIAFVRGAAYPEEEDRYRAYTGVLAEHGIAFDPDLVTPHNDQQRSDGAEAIRLLLDERKVSFQAVVAANDALALGAMDALQERGTHVPGDVAVVGFDDVDEARVTTPSLTTVRLPVYEMGKQATEMLLALLAGEPVPEQVTIPAELVVRQSCGCLDAEVTRAAVGPVTTSSETVGAVLAAQWEAILAEVMQAAGAADASLDSEWTEQLLSAFADELEGGAPGAFLSTLDEALRQTATAGGDLAVWQEALTTLRRYALPCLVNSPETLSRAEDLWQQGRVMIGRVIERARAHQALREQRQARMLDEIGQSLLTVTNMTELADVLAQAMPKFGIPSCYLALYENPESPADWSRLILAYDERGRVDLADGQRFPSRELAPGGMFRRESRYGMTLEPLHFARNPLGFALLEASPKEAWAREVLRVHIGSALHNVLLAQQTKSRAIQLQTAAEVSRAASSILDRTELLQQVVDIARERFDLYYAGLFLVDHTGERTGEPGKWAVLRAVAGEAGQEMLKQGHKLEIGGDSMIGWCVANRRARIALDVGREAVRFENPLLPQTRSELALPLVSRGQAIGALTIQSAQPAAFSEGDIAVFQTMTDQVANAIENARLFEQTQKRAEELAVLNEMSRALSARLDTDGVIKSIHQYTSRLMDTTNFYVALYDEQQNAVSFPLYADGERVRSVGPRQAGRGMTEYVIRTREPLLIKENIPPRLAELGIELIGQTAESWLGVPMVIGERVVGVITVQSYTTPRLYDERHRDLLNLVANQAAIALENAHLFEQTQARAEREQMLNVIMARARASLTLDQVLGAAVQQLGTTLGAARVAVLLKLDDESRSLGQPTGKVSGDGRGNGDL